MESDEDIRLAREIIHALLRSKKIVRMYPPNHPVYRTMVEGTYAKFSNFFDYSNELPLVITQNSIAFDSAQLYSSTDKYDNFALLFFKDGIRELRFTQGLSLDELLEFIKIIALDFEREVVDDDLVTLLWESEFEHIQYVADEAFLIEGEGEDQEDAAEQVKRSFRDENRLVQAYEDLKGESREEATLAIRDKKTLHGDPLLDITEEDLRTLEQEMEGHSKGKMEKLAEILFAILLQAETAEEFQEVLGFIKEMVHRSLQCGSLEMLVRSIKNLHELAEGVEIPDEMKGRIKALIASFASSEYMHYAGEILDTQAEGAGDLFHEFICFLDTGAIAPLVSILGRLQSIHARKQVINLLIELGGKDIRVLTDSLGDSQWYVVRNIVHILRNIGNRECAAPIIKVIGHDNANVRKEAIKALGELQDPLALSPLKGCLDDPDPMARKMAVRALGNFSTEPAKNILLEKVKGKEFLEKHFDEKKVFFEVLSRWNDEGVAAVMMRILKEKSLLKKTPYDENRACAAFCLGLMKRKEALPLLEGCARSRNTLLRGHAEEAIKSIQSV